MMSAKMAEKMKICKGKSFFKINVDSSRFCDFCNLFWGMRFRTCEIFGAFAESANLPFLVV